MCVCVLLCMSVSSGCFLHSAYRVCGWEKKYLMFSALRSPQVVDIQLIYFCNRNRRRFERTLSDSLGIHLCGYKRGKSGTILSKSHGGFGLFLLLFSGLGEKRVVVGTAWHIVFWAGKWQMRRQRSDQKSTECDGLPD